MTEATVTQADEAAAISAWNGIADEFNQWGNLSDAERVHWLEAFARHREAHSTAASQASDAVEKWGPPINLGGKRPDWLDGDETIMGGEGDASGFFIGPARMIPIDYLMPPIRLRPDHPIYATLTAPSTSGEEMRLREAREAFFNLIADARKWGEVHDEEAIYYTLETTHASLIPLMNALGIEQQHPSIEVDGANYPGHESPAEAIDRAMGRSNVPAHRTNPARAILAQQGGE